MLYSPGEPSPKTLYYTRIYSIMFILETFPTLRCGDYNIVGFELSNGWCAGEGERERGNCTERKRAKLLKLFKFGEHVSTA